MARPDGRDLLSSDVGATKLAPLIYAAAFNLDGSTRTPGLIVAASVTLRR